MRQAGTLPSKSDAERFATYLVSQGISSKVEPAGEAWAVWVHDENQIPRSRQELEVFQRQPDDPRYRDAQRVAAQLTRQAEEKKRQAQRNYVDMRGEWSSPWRRRPVTLALIIASVAVWFHIPEVPDEALYFSLPHIMQGEVWRLVTPIFLHFSVPHILFNLWWLYDLGTIIERKLGSFLFALTVLVIAVTSNDGQYLATGPGFGGMSGVVYGLFGYAWARGRLEPTSGLYLRNDIAVWMVGWFVLCAVGVIPNVANWAHGVGLGVGAFLGALPYIGQQLRQKT